MLNVSVGVNNVGGSAKLYAKVLASFVLETESLLHEMGATKDRKIIAELAHKGKGSCGTVGALKAQHLCKQVQKQAEDAESEFDDQLLVALQEELKLVIAEAKRYLSQA